MSALSARVVPANALDDVALDRMFWVFQQYYDQVTYETFVRDLSSKDDVILLEDRAGRILGFSTMRKLRVTVDGRVVHGLFSGDTVVDRAHWGQRVLGRAFLAYLFREKAKRPFSPYYWFLISKGYKTYLLMANNFAEHYPRYEQPTPAGEQRVLDAFATLLFEDAYDRERGVIAFPESHGQVRRGVADITPDLLAHERVAYFQVRNPGWVHGTELACIAKMTFGMPFAYAAKAWLRGRARATKPTAQTAPIAATALRDAR